MIIYELKPYLTGHNNLFLDVEDAKTTASEALADWKQMYIDMRDDEDYDEQDHYPLVDELVWSMELPTDWPARPGQEVLTAYHDEKHKFEIYEREVVE